MNKDLHNDITQAVGFKTTAISTDTTTAGEIIDTQGYYGLEYILQSGTLTTGTYTPVVEHGDDAALADAAVVPATYLLGTLADATFAATDDDTAKRIGYVGHKRYVRLSITSASSAAGTMSAVAVLNHPRHAPTA
jgi:hypothetical protein